MVNWNTLSRFAERENVLFVIKPHPYEHEVARLSKIGTFNNIKIYYGSDPQWLLKKSDVLITDYSSVYMDYLLLDRPIIFFPYDYNDYVERLGRIQFDYMEFVPGSVVFEQRALYKELTDIIKGQDKYKELRNRWKNIVWQRTETLVSPIDVNVIGKLSKL